MSRFLVAILLLISDPSASHRVSGAAIYVDSEPHTCEEVDAEEKFCVFNWNTTKSWPIKNWTKSNEFCMNFVGNSFLLNEYVNVQFEQIFEIFRYSNAAVDEMIWTGLRLIGGSLVWESVSPASMLTRAIPRKGFDIEPGEYEHTDDTELCGALQRSTRLVKLISCSSQINFTCFQMYPKLSTYPPLTNSSYQFNPYLEVPGRSSLDGRYERDVYRQSYKKCDKGWVTGRNPNLCFKAMDKVVSCDTANEECSRYESGSLALYDDLDLEKLNVNSGEYFIITGRETQARTKDVYIPDDATRCTFIDVESKTLHHDWFKSRKYICQQPKIESKPTTGQNVFINFSSSLEYTKFICRPSHVDLSPSNPLIHSVNNYFRIPPYDDPEYYYDHLATSEIIQRRLSVGLSQGYHNCYIWDFNPLSGIYERNLDSSTLVKFTDIKTDYLYVTINYSEPLAWTDVYSFVTFDYIMDWTSNPHIQKWMSWLNSSYAYLEKIMKIKKKKGVGTMLDVKINVYSQKTAKRMSKIFSRQVLLNNMERQGPVPDEFEEKKFLRSNSPPAKWLKDKYMKVKNSEGCYKEIVSFGSDKFFFDVGLPDEVASSDILCHMRGFPPKAKAKCSGNFVFGYSWVLNELLDCASFNINGADESSNLTKSFYDILRKDMRDYDDLLETTKDLLTKDPTGSTIQSNDISLVAAILEKSNSTDFHMSTNVAETMVTIVDELLSSPVETFEKAQERTAASLSILNSMETLVKKLSEVSQDINVTWSGKNLVTHFYETSVHNQSLGFALLKLKMGNKSEKYIYGDGVLEAGGDNLDEDLEVALFLPDEIYRRKSPLEEDFPVKTSLIVYKTATLFQSSMTSSSPLSFAKISAGHNGSSLDEKGKVPADDDGCEDVFNRKINSLVIKSSVGGRKISNLKEKVKIKFRLKNNAISNPSCVYAKYMNDRIEWSTDGLETIDSNVKDFYIECESDHLTNFAVLAGFEKDLHSKKVGIALQWVSMIGMIISIVCLSLVIIGQIIFKKFRKGQYHIALLNLSISLICVNLIIMFGLDKKPPSPPLSSSSCTSSSTSSISRKTIGCLVVSALLHYFLLVSFSWMLIEAILQYLKFVKVFNTHISSFVWKTMLPAWILPAIVVIVTGSVDYRLFDGFKHHCWLAKKAFYLAFLLPLGFIILANIVVFMRVIKGISCDRPKGMVTNQSQCKLIWLQVQVALCCFVIMGLTWSFAFFAYGDASVVMYFLFAIFNSLQGLFIFLLFNLREKPVRVAWSSFVRKPAKHLPFSTSSTGATAPNTSKFTPNKFVDKDKKKALSTELDFLNATSSGRSLDDAEKNNLKKRSGSDGKSEGHVNTFSKSN